MRVTQYVGLAISVTALTACQVIGSDLGPNQTLARQSAGTYYLAKHLVKVEAKDGVFTVTTEAAADRDWPLQTGFHLSSLADDDVKVTYHDGLIRTIGVTATDRTGEALTALAQSITRLRSGGDVTEGTRIFKFDPFDPRDAIQVNRILRTLYKGCVEVELVPGYWSPGCGQYSLGQSTAVPKFQPPNPTNSEAGLQPGVYYRPLERHRVHVVEQGQSVGMLSLNFANRNKVRRLDVKRTMFVERKTIVTFVGGVPTEVQVTKDSEALAAATLPVTIANGIVDQTVAALGGRQKVIAAQTSLANAQVKKINAETQLLETISASTRAGDSAAARDAAVLTNAFRSSPIAGVTRADCEQFGFEDLRECAAVLAGVQ